MSKVVVFTNLTLDGVMQAPGRPDEDRRGGFEHGGWATPYAAMAQAGESTATTSALLLGRRYLRRYPARRHQDDDQRRRDSDLRSHALSVNPHILRAE